MQKQARHVVSLGYHEVCLECSWRQAEKRRSRFVLDPCPHRPLAQADRLVVAILTLKLADSSACGATLYDIGQFQPRTN